MDVLLESLDSFMCVAQKVAIGIGATATQIFWNVEGGGCGLILSHEVVRGLSGSHIGR